MCPASALSFIWLQEMRVSSNAIKYIWCSYFALYRALVHLSQSFTLVKTKIILRNNHSLYNYSFSLTSQMTGILYQIVNPFPLASPSISLSEKVLAIVPLQHARAFRRNRVLIVMWPESEQTLECYSQCIFPRIICVMNYFTSSSQEAEPEKRLLCNRFLMID